MNHPFPTHTTPDDQLTDGSVSLPVLPPIRRQPRIPVRRIGAPHLSPSACDCLADLILARSQTVAPLELEEAA